MVQPVSELCVTSDQSILDAIACIDRAGEGVALVTDHDNRLVGVVTDGDIRRATLARMDFELPVRVLLEEKSKESPKEAVTAPVGTTDQVLLDMMNIHQLRHVPILDEGGRVAGIGLLRELARDHSLQLDAVVMAGGLGRRLEPLTNNTPKSMLPMGEKPLLEGIVRQLQSAGITKVNIATHHLGEVIKSHFGSGRDFGIDIEYFEEDEPLGTAGALRLLKSKGDPVLVINGDIVTGIDFRSMLDFHREHAADVTVAVKQYDLQIPYGVIEVEGSLIRRISEKPTISHFINSGVYLLNANVRAQIPEGKRFDMTELISGGIEQGLRVVCFPVREYWLDIGRIEDYEQALMDLKQEGRPG